MQIIEPSQLKVRKGFMFVVGTILVIVVSAFFFLIVEVPISLVDKSDWETYKNSEYGYEFKHPKQDKIGRNLNVDNDGREVCFPGFGVFVHKEKKSDNIDIESNKIIVDWNLGNVYRDGEANAEIIKVNHSGNTFDFYSCYGYGGVDVNKDILSTFKFTE